MEEIRKTGTPYNPQFVPNDEPKPTEEKIKNKEARKGATINLLDAAETLKEPEVTNVEADRIFGEVSDGEK